MPLRPVLPPGGDVVRRDARTLVVGGRPGVTVPDRPGLVALLRLLDGRGLDAVARLAAERVPELDVDVRSLIRGLVAQGALAAQPPAPPPALSVRVQAWRGSERTASLVRTALDDLDLRPDPASEEALLVLVAAGEPPRSWIERAVETGVPVLPLVVGADWSRLGPLTVAGRTPCLGCHDAERATWDPTWNATLTQLGRPIVPAPPPRPATSLLMRAGALAADEVLACAERRRPDTLGGVLHLAGRHVEREPVRVHDDCTSLLHRAD
jgi:hypothetical protein